MLPRKERSKETNLANKFVPEFVPENLPWYKRDSLLTWYDQAKCRDFLEDTDGHFRTTKIVNFDIINKDLKKEKISKETLKGYQILNYEQVMTYPPEVQRKIFESAFRTDRKDIFFKKESIDEYLKKQ